ncbi:prephenate dehydratase [Dehalogenimonas etheniformans]|uniref:Bifunctional chorismate mutase/prephenate dehydratase n=1 Tax=Dehalogenimonas etheniformans TaxID=1536648 RepID=A0A2P5P7F3_9CHLR|nr:prephenate dehydratase [Dehalogenimonas etheniformans]PPD58238.1 prephenate dehydratase [Dehalogenimonas etheniformans]QNT75647.1 prephenate dehydratase [Dehalogenimonas etheniformans]
MSLDELRRRIDQLDENIVKMLAERLSIAESIGHEKAAGSTPPIDPGRERKVLDHAISIASAGGMTSDEITEIYRSVIKLARQRQEVSVAFQGEAGAYSEAAALDYFGSRSVATACESLEDVFKKVENGNVQFGMIPIENSVEGSISRSYDLMLESDLMVAGEINLRVNHCLIGNPGSTLDGIKRVYSHPQALGQTGHFLRQLHFELIPTSDTAGSVKLLKEKGIMNGAAVASERAAAIYGMKILARDIMDNPNNFTRFFALGGHDAPPSGDDKTSVVFAVKHKPGALYDFLRILAERKINLTKIESRPTRKKAWEYNFYLDFEGHRQDEKILFALPSLEEHTLFFKILGSYPKAKSEGN